MTILFFFIIFTVFCLVSIMLARILFGKKHIAELISDQVCLLISVPTKNKKSPLAAEQLFQSLHGAMRYKDLKMQPYSFEIVATVSGIFFLVVCAKRYKQFVENQIYSQYPSAQVRQIKDYAREKTHDNLQTVSSEIGLEKDFYLPIKTFSNFDVDPLASITGAMSKVPKDYEVWVQLVARPIPNKWQEGGKKYVNHMKSRKNSEGQKVQLESGENTELREIEAKNTKVGFQSVIRLMVHGPDQLTASQLLEDIEASYQQFQTGQLNALKRLKQQSGILAIVRRLILGKTTGEKMSSTERFQERYLNTNSTNIINVEELASLFHLPNESVETPNIVWAKSKKLEFPKEVPLNSGRIFAKTDYRGIEIPFGIKDLDRRRHMYLLGKTGSGKSTLLKNMIIADIREGKGVAVIDPHGDLVEELLTYIPESRADEVIYLDPSDMDNPIGINLLDLKESETIELLSDGIVSVFKRYFDSWGPRLQYILTNTILTLLYCQNVSLLAVQRILVDSNYRKFLLKQVNDPFLQQFWEHEYEEMAKNPRLLTEAVAPIQNKVGRFLNSPMIRNMVGQVKSKIDLEDVMNSGKILLVNLSQGKIGEENSSLLGGMLVTRLYSNAMQRARMEESDRRDFYVYVDEFQNFATDSFSKILSEARKYALNLIVTHQYIDQISEDLQSAIFGNVGTLMNFVVGQADANRLAKEYEPYLESEDLVNLERHCMSIKLMVDGAQSVPFTAKSLAPFFKPVGLQDLIKDRSRQNYASEREVIEEKLNKWSTQQYNEKGNLVSLQQSQPSGKKQTNQSKAKKRNT